MSLTRLCHSAIVGVTAFGHRRFQQALRSPETAQKRKLQGLLTQAQTTRFGASRGLDAQWSYEKVASTLPVTEYEQWRTLVEEQRTTGDAVLSHDCSRYQPTSGSTSSVKWIPYSAALLSEFDEAFSPWLYDTAGTYPELLQGRHYWSLSWLPNNLRNQLENTSDLELFPWWKRFVMSQTMTVPSQVSLTPTSEAASFATMAYLAACSDLSFISVWSPTFALNFLTQIESERYELASILETGDWGKWRDSLGGLRCPRNKVAAKLLLGWDGRSSADFFQTLWPKLALVSSWDTASSKHFAAELREKLRVPLQGKGLWATEAVVTIPFQGKYPLALNSHFYEFKCLDTGKVFPSWKLEPGQTVQPILSTGGGFWRYALRDRLKVTGTLHATPCFEFLGRLDGCDLVGEKISPELADGVLRELTDYSGSRWLSMIAVPSTTPGVQKPFYLVLGQSQGLAKDVTLQEKAEDLLCGLFHYRLARELGQLDPCRILLTSDPRSAYLDMMDANNTIAGNLKVESVALLKAPVLSSNYGFEAER